MKASHLTGGEGDQGVPLSHPGKALLQPRQIDRLNPVAFKGIHGNDIIANTDHTIQQKIAQNTDIRSNACQNGAHDNPLDRTKGVVGNNYQRTLIGYLFQFTRIEPVLDVKHVKDRVKNIFPLSSLFHSLLECVIQAIQAVQAQKSLDRILKKF